MSNYQIAEAWNMDQLSDQVQQIISSLMHQYAAHKMMGWLSANESDNSTVCCTFKYAEEKKWMRHETAYYYYWSMFQHKGTTTKQHTKAIIRAVYVSANVYFPEKILPCII